MNEDRKDACEDCPTIEPMTEGEETYYNSAAARYNRHRSPTYVVPGDSQPYQDRFLRRFDLVAADEHSRKAVRDFSVVF